MKNTNMNANTNFESKTVDEIAKDILGMEPMNETTNEIVEPEYLEDASEDEEVADSSFAEDVLNDVEPEIDLGICVPEATDEYAEVLESAKEPVKEVKKFRTSNQTVCVKTYLNRFKSGDVKIPDCQRMFVWTDKQVAELMNSIRCNMAIPPIQLGEVDGVAYLVDGLQRTTALMKLAEDKKLSEDDKKTLMSYKIGICTTHEMDWETFNRWFYNCNNGTPLASAVKESAKLSANMQEAVFKLAGNEFFRTAPMQKTPQKGDHKRVIAMSFMCSAAGLFPGTVAGNLSKQLNNAEDLILSHVDAATTNLQTVLDGLKQLKKEFVEKAMNANYITAWGKVLKEMNNVSADEIAEVTMRVFEGSKALPGYRATIGSGAASANAFKNRANFYISELQKLRAERTIDWESKGI